jgi:hypothetical protein
MSWIAAGVIGGSAIIKGVEGISQNAKASGIEKQNPYPTEGVQQEYFQNVNQAQQMAQQGIPAAAYNNQLNQINQNQAGALSTLGRSANPGANLASIVRQGDQATNNLNAQDAVARNRNMLQLLQERQQLAQQKDKAWDWNYQQRYLGNLAKSQALRQSANANINGALSDVSSGAVSLAALGAFDGSGGGGGGAGQAYQANFNQAQGNAAREADNFSAGNGPDLSSIENIPAHT